jgi:mRNA interferase MazF
VVVVPLTSNIDKLYQGEALVSLDKNQSKVMSDQITAADKARLKSKVGVLSHTDMMSVEEAIKLHLSFLK